MDARAVPRIDPPTEAGERPTLEAFLEYHRSTLMMKCQGLDDEQLRLRSIPPSNLSLLGLVRHLAEVERHWFRRVLGAQHVSQVYCTDESPDADFDDVDDADGTDAF